MQETDPGEHKTGGAIGLKITGMIRELVFGAEDGLLATLGLVTGVAAGTSNPHVILLAGIVGAISGAISMGAGNYLGVKSEIEVLERTLREEEVGLGEHPDHEIAELSEYYRGYGMTPEEIGVIVPAIMRNKDFLMEEMASHELHISAEDLKNPIGKAFWMFISYLLAAMLPVWPYAAFGHGTAFWTSIGVAAVAVFAIGAVKTIFTGRALVKSGFEMLAVAASAGIIGYIAGHFAGVAGV